MYQQPKHGLDSAGLTLLRKLCGTGILCSLFASQLGWLACSAESEQPAAPPVASSPQDAAGPARLKQQVRVTVETNAPATGAEASKKSALKNLEWQASWNGWDGLHLALTRKTLLGQQVNELTNAYVAHLEETRMVGKIGAKFALDAAAFVADDDLDGFDAGAELRRARIYAKGDCLVVVPVSYQLEVGYIPDQFFIEESYLAFKDLACIGELRLGQYQAPMGLEAINSARDITFMEPAAPIQALAPGVNAGIQMGRPFLNQRATWTLGLFTDGVGEDFGDASQDFGRLITRFTALPIDHPNPDSPGHGRLLHLGLSANILYSGSSTVRYQARPESHLSPYVVDTGDISSSAALVLGGEVAWVNGPFSMQGEFLHSFVDQADGDALHFHGLYASAGWFLTGESRPYSRPEGTFGRVMPRRNFNWGRGGWGAWEIAGRYSFVNLNSGAIAGGRLSMLMVGLNWYLHPHVKWRFDYGFGSVSGRDPAGNLNLFQTRVELDF